MSIDPIFTGRHGVLYDEFAAILQSADFAACLERTEHVAVACSGGADSSALALLLRLWCRREGKRLTALIVDHGLRAESAAEAEAVKRALSQAGIFAVVLRSHKKHDFSSNIQAKARDLRYDLLSDYCVRHAIGCLFLGHHLRDQAETFLLRLRRGSHIKGLSCMDAVGILSSRLSDGGGDVHLLRPLLSVDNRRLRDLAEAQGWSWVSDPSNDSEAFERVRMRKLLPVLEGCGLDAEILAATAEHMRLADDFIESQAQAFIRRLRLHACGYISGHRDLWRQSHPLLHYVLLAYIWRRLRFGDYPPRARSLAALAQAICGGGDLSARVLGGVMMFGRGDEVLFCREYAAMDREFYDLSVLAQDFIWDGRFRVSFGGAADEGYYLGPGMEGLSDFGSGLPSVIRRVLPAVYRDGAVCSYPLLDFYDAGVEALRDDLRVETAW